MNLHGNEGLLLCAAANLVVHGFVALAQCLRAIEIEMVLNPYPAN